MLTYIHPERSQWTEIIERPVMDNSRLQAQVQALLFQIKNEGDKAVIALEEQFDHAHLTTLRVSDEEIESACRQIPPTLAKAIDTAAENIAKFHAAQRHDYADVETTPGVHCRQKAVPIDRVGLYVPGGTAPLFSTVLMLAVPARIAGCPEIVLCTPPSATGAVHPAILYAARRAGVTQIFKAGGIQSIGAMAYGTESVPRVYKIFGPGNQYVQMAKQCVAMRDVAIDMPAGPSEVAVIADAQSNPDFVAIDFLSQAEHGPDSQALLFTCDEDFVAPFQEALHRQLSRLSRQAYTCKSLEHSKVVVLHDEAELMDLVNEYAPEHLIIQTQNYRALGEQVRNAGSVFLGPYTPESAGDYASGTNHTLPTNGYAKAYNGVNLDSFIRKVTFQEISADGLRSLGPTIEAMAEAELLDAHRNAVGVRLNQL
jgi:histidinol dehydrogenase